MEQSGSFWDNYALTESEEHKKVYVKKTGSGFLDESNLWNSETDLDEVDIGSIDLNIFALAKANTRKKTFLQLNRRFLADDLSHVSGID